MEMTKFRKKKNKNICAEMKFKRFLFILSSGSIRYYLTGGGGGAICVSLFSILADRKRTQNSSTKSHQNVIILKRITLNIFGNIFSLELYFLIRKINKIIFHSLMILIACFFIHHVSRRV